ncbi:MAG: bifunctional folylpolyglutamate synthase/dihydrofolate synthase [Chitinophagaceae bacterium]|nr:MAG: bifunctional folylpolyglutamate synthase/dihydrofolate synthase [Chitinophagaceae bacterium]
MTKYEATIEYIFSKLPMFSRIGSEAIKIGLSNITDLCNLLNNPQNNFKTIHIAGTNGKGSVSHMIASVLQEAGYKTGLYTSPHLKDLRERIRVNGKMMTQNAVIDFVATNKENIERIQPSFFEINVAMAFQYFAKEKVEVAVIETGLGGRLDSTNIIQPILSVITNIGYDHVQILGDTLDKIAFEKAGIIKYKTPVVIGETQDETTEVFKFKAAENSAPLFFADQQFSVSNFTYKNEKLHVHVKNNFDHSTKHYELDLTGNYQTKNILTVLTSIHQLQVLGLNISNENMMNGLAQAKRNTGLRGRWEILEHNPKVIIDVAHNKDGMLQVLHQLTLTDYKNLHIIIGMVKDKDVDSVLQLLPSTATYYFTNASVPRAMSKDELQQKAQQFHLLGNSYHHVSLALESAKNNANPDDLILICGSIFLVAEIL